MFLSTTKLKALRNDQGWSQEALAKACGLSVRTIQRIEADGKASAESALSIASVFKVSPQELVATSDEIEVNWKRKVIMKHAVALLIISGAIGLLIYMGGTLYTYADAPTGLFLILFLYAATIVAYGTNGLFASIRGLKYLFTDEMVGGTQAQYLATLFKSQVKFLYGGALIGFVIGFIAVNSNIDTYADFVFHRAVAVNLLVLFYAAVLNEGIFRPLSLKLESCDMKA